MKNLKSVTFALDIDAWSDDNWIYGDIPKKIKQLAENHYPHRYVFDQENLNNDCFHITFNNVPKTFVSYILISKQGVSVAGQEDYCQIHPDVLPLFDFGDND